MMTAQKRTAAPDATGSGGEEIIHDEDRQHYQPKVTEGKGLGLYRWYQWKAKQEIKRKVAALPHANRIAVYRLPELERLYAHRYGRFLPDDDAGRDDLTVMLLTACFTGSDGAKRMRGIVARWAPWLPKKEAQATIKAIRSAPRWLAAETLTWRLRITLAEREALRITTIRCIELPTKEALDQYRRDKWNEKRRKPKKPTVAELAKAEGISRSTYYRRQKSA